MKTTFKSIVKEHMALAKEFILSIPDIQQRVISMREGVNKTITASAANVRVAAEKLLANPNLAREEILESLPPLQNLTLRCISLL